MMIDFILKCHPELVEGSLGLASTFRHPDPDREFGKFSGK